MRYALNAKGVPKSPIKLAGPKARLAEGWRLIREDATIGGTGTGLVMDDPSPIGQYHGCNHLRSTIALPNGALARAVEYDMEGFLGSCVSRCLDFVTEIQGGAPCFTAEVTPFLVDTSGGSPTGSYAILLASFKQTVWIGD